MVSTKEIRNFIFSFRTHYFLTIIGLLVLSAVLQTGCSTPAQIIKESSTPVRPGWLIQPPQKENLYYFVGIKTGTESLEDGRNGAINDAMGKISNLMGSKIKSVFEEKSNEIEQKLQQQITSKSSATISGASIIDWYHEKMTRIDKNFRMEKYDVYVLMSFPKSEVEKETSRQKKEKEDRVKTAYDLYLKGLKLEKQNTLTDAQKIYKQAVEILSELDDLVNLDKGEVKNSEELNNLLKTRFQAVISKRRRMILSIKFEGPEKSRQIFQSSLASALSENGFTVTQEEPAIEIIGELSVMESSFVMNNFVFYAEGNISARQTFDGQIVAVIPLKVKGFHQTREQAALNALAEAGIEAGKNLAKTLLEKEN